MRVLGHDKPLRECVATTVAAVAGLVLFGAIAVHAGLTKYYSIDEFMHAHAAWLVGRGAVPYRDFFDFHFPLLYQVLGLVWTVLPDDPEKVRFLRGVLLVFVALLLAAAALVNRRERRPAVLLAPLLALSISPFVVRATEIRHDTLAFALYLGAVAVLFVESLNPRARGALSGILVVLAVWGSQKVLMYGLPFGLLIGVEAWRGVRRGGPSTLGSRSAFVAGAGVTLSSLGLYLVATGSGRAFFDCAVRGALRWQSDYPPFPWTQVVAPVGDGWGWLLPFAILGAGFSAVSLARGRTLAPTAGEIILLASFATSFLYVVALPAPYEYNLIPFFVFLAIFAARGLSEALYRLFPAGAAAVAVAAVVFLVTAEIRVWERTAETNEGQHRVLADIGVLTAPRDVAYDNSGSFVARPSASYYFYTDAPMRARFGAFLEREIPKAILESGAVLAVRDARYDVLSPGLKEFLRSHFQPFSGDLWLWGQRFRSRGTGRMTGSFLAVRDGRFFVTPADFLSHGELLIDDVRVSAPVLELRKGVHRIEWECNPGSDFYLLWLPRDGRTWTPQPQEPPRFSRVL